METVFALFCERALIEHDGMGSFIRVLDRLNFRGPTQKMKPVSAPLTLVVMGRSDILRGEGSIEVTPVAPSGESLEPILLNTRFQGELGSFLNIHALDFMFTEPGLYWFHIAIEGVPVTKAPLFVVYQTVPKQSQICQNS